MESNNLKNILTNIVAVAAVIIGAGNAYLQSSSGSEVDWFQLGIAIIAAVVAYFTGKDLHSPTKAAK